MRLPKSPPPILALMKGYDGESLMKLLAAGIGGLSAGRYDHWDKLRHLTPPPNVTHEAWWLAAKFARAGASRRLPFKSKGGLAFSYALPDFLQAALHRVDQNASGRIELPAEVANPGTRDRYLVSSLIEESITSSQLEGASTTRQVAKAMLREGRAPRDRSEKMIANNFRAMQFVSEMRDQALSKENLLELHRIVTQDTFDDPAAEGRFRTASDKVLVVDARDNTVLHDPPTASELPDRINALCEFANERGKGTLFLHPVVRSILLHFMVGYDHPFVDGNGRTARALFYWSMARHGYWMMEFVSISTIIRRAPSQYARAYLYTETDDNDTTYFLDFNLRVIEKGIAALHQYLARKSGEVRDAEAVLGVMELNHRQIALVSHALKHAGGTYLIESHRVSHNVTYQTARTDLLKLVELGLLAMRRRGRTYVFRGLPDLQDKLRSLAKGADKAGG